MRKIREVLRLRLVAQLSFPQIAASLKMSAGAAHKIIKSAEAAGLIWSQVMALEDTELEKIIYGNLAGVAESAYQELDCPTIYQELKRKGVTLSLLWEEYKAVYGERAYSYTQYCYHYQQWKAKLKLSMRQQHRAGEKLFVDYSGQTMPVIDPATGEIRQAQIFVAVMGASNYTYAEATWTQTLPDWIASHIRTFEYLQGCPEIVVPDNLKSGVTKACRYEPDINPTYANLAAHYNVAVIPARPVHPRDKAAAEVGVQIVQRWLLARLRHQQFFSLGELNKAIRALLESLNNRPMKKLNTTRRKLYEELEKPVFKALPVLPYQYCEWQRMRVPLDYHIEAEQHYYSVPYRLVKEQIDIRLTKNIVEIFHKGKRVASHPRSSVKGGKTTMLEHMPKAHQAHIQWTVSALKKWAATVGAATEQVVLELLATNAHPEQGYRRCLGLFSLSNRYTQARLEQACRRSLVLGTVSYKSIRSILAKRLDLLPLPESAEVSAPPVLEHENLRGAAYFNTAELFN
jgi:transposase